MLKCNTDAVINNSLYLWLLEPRFHWDHFLKSQEETGSEEGKTPSITESHGCYSVDEGSQPHGKVCLIRESLERDEEE